MLNKSQAAKHVKIIEKWSWQTSPKPATLKLRSHPSLRLVLPSETSALLRGVRSNGKKDSAAKRANSLKAIVEEEEVIKSEDFVWNEASLDIEFLGKKTWKTMENTFCVWNEASLDIEFLGKKKHGKQWKTHFAFGDERN